MSELMKIPLLRDAVAMCPREAVLGFKYVPCSADGPYFVRLFDDWEPVEGVVFNKLIAEWAKP